MQFSRVASLLIGCVVIEVIPSGLLIAVLSTQTWHSVSLCKQIIGASN